MKKPVILLIHGYPFDRTLWFPVITALGTKVHVLMPDVPGFGNAPVLPLEPSIDHYAHEMVRFLDASSIGKAVIAGMSMGGYIALALAEHYPNRVAGLALISTQAASDSDEARSNRLNLVKKIETIGTSAAYQAILPKMFTDQNSSNPDFTDPLFQGTEKAGVPGLTWALKAMAARPDRSAVLKNLTVPVLVLHGEEDKIIPIQKAREMSALAGEGHFTAIKNCGHCSPMEAPDALAMNLLKLARVAFRPHLPQEPVPSNESKE
ncbi:MAG: alpha/beta hydrolase [Verrucomicrobiota bacterium]|nr:alpha/beta hydrolase [Verrucomicrobiota bacterium]